MNAELRKQVVLNTAWLVGLGVVSVGLVWGMGAWLDARRARIDSTRLELSQLASEVERCAAEQALDSGRAVEALREARALADGESLRIEQLAAAARAAGVTVLALRGRPPEDRAEGRVVVCAHELEVSGDYRQVATFLGELQRAPGMVGIEELEIEPADETGLVLVCLVVSWFAPGPGDATAPTETEAS